MLGNPLAGGGFPGDSNPYIHTTKDTMDVDDKIGYFSIDVSAIQDCLGVIQTNAP